MTSRVLNLEGAPTCSRCTVWSETSSKYGVENLESISKARVNRKKRLPNGKSELKKVNRAKGLAMDIISGAPRPKSGLLSSCKQDLGHLGSGKLVD
jgi:hypothetical protein